MKVKTVGELLNKAVYLRKDGTAWMKVPLRTDAVTHVRVAVHKMEDGGVVFGANDHSEAADATEKVVVLAE